MFVKVFVCTYSSLKYYVDFTEQDLEKLFSDFSNTTWQEKDMFIACNTSVTIPKKESSKTLSRCSGMIVYRLKHQGCAKQVCKKFFLNNLGIKEWIAQNWIKKHNKATDKENTHGDDPDQILTTKNLEKDTVFEKKLHIDTGFEKLPNLPSYYTR